MNWACMLVSRLKYVLHIYTLEKTQIVLSTKLFFISIKKYQVTIQKIKSFFFWESSGIFHYL